MKQKKSNIINKLIIYLLATRSQLLQVHLCIYCIQQLIPCKVLIRFKVLKDISYEQNLGNNNHIVS